jgi:fructokinase
MTTPHQPTNARVGVDLGGTKIEAAVLDRSGRILGRERVPTPHDYRATIDAIAQLVLGLESRHGVRGTVGVGIPGAVEPRTGLVKNANSIWLIGKPLRGDLETALARPVRMENDANCFALSEAADGAGAGASNVFGVILGTGVGGGIVIDGKVIEGVNLIAGEWGHNPLPWITLEEYPGPACYCGKKGCIETFLSGPGFENDFAASTGRRLAASAIVEAASAGESAARDALAHLGRSYLHRELSAEATTTERVEDGWIGCRRQGRRLALVFQADSQATAAAIIEELSR